MSGRRLWTVALAVSLAACTFTPVVPPYSDASRAKRLQELLPADIILLGEQHDAADHQQVHRTVVETLAAKNSLAALALEMASQGQSTAGLSRDATEDVVRQALQWNNEGWPWSAYGPTVMAAVRAGVPVVGANLPSNQLRNVMARTELDALLTGPALKAQQQNIRTGHCDMLPESQIVPMTRVQIARDIAMADTLARAVQAGKTVVLLAGGGHVDRSLGVPLHLTPGVKVKAVLIRPEIQVDLSDPESAANFDAIWPAQPAPVVDYCAKFSASRRSPT